MVARPGRLDDGWLEARRRSRNLTRTALAIDLAGLTIDEIRDGAIDGLPSDVVEALDRVAPEFSFAEIASYSADQFDGLVNLVKGALFEQQVVEGLADGTLGDVRLPEGSSVRLADFGQRGYDLEVVDPKGAVVGEVQLKASGNAELVGRHLDRYPEIAEVWTTSEAAEHAVRRGIPVVDTGISADDLTRHVRTALIDQRELSLMEVLDEIVPQVTVVLILASWAVAVASGVDPGVARADARRRLMDAMVASTLAGLAASATGTDAVRIPVAIAIRLLAARGQRAAASALRLRQLGEVVGSRRP